MLSGSPAEPPRSLLARVRLGTGRHIIYVSRIYESFSVQIAVLVFSSLGKLLRLLKLDKRRESHTSWHFSAVGRGGASREVLLISNSCGLLSLFIKTIKQKKIDKSIPIILSARGESGADLCMECKAGLGSPLAKAKQRLVPQQCVTSGWDKWGLSMFPLPHGECCHHVTLQKPLFTAPKALCNAFPPPFSFAFLFGMTLPSRMCLSVAGPGHVTGKGSGLCGMVQRTPQRLLTRQGHDLEVVWPG